MVEATSDEVTFGVSMRGELYMNEGGPLGLAIMTDGVIDTGPTLRVAAALGSRGLSLLSIQPSESALLTVPGQVILATCVPFRMTC